MDTFGQKVQVTIFGESHGAGLGAVISGLPAGFMPDLEALNAHMARRAPGQGSHTTARKEADIPRLISGITQQGVLTGSPIAAVIDNTDARSADYSSMPARPSHADYPAFVKYGGYAARAGGGRFSGRITAALCVAGGLCMQVLAGQGITIQSRITRIGTVVEASWEDYLQEIEKARMDGDSVGGQIECIVQGLPVGVGEPFFDSVESTLAHLLFSIPAVKGVSFGDGFDLCAMHGSKSNDPMGLKDGAVVRESNRMGGVDGGISNGSPLRFTVGIKPTPTIGLPQRSVDLPPTQQVTVEAKGRHDPCIVPRALPVVESCAAIGLLDLLMIGGIYRG